MGKMSSTGMRASGTAASRSDMSGLRPEPLTRKYRPVAGSGSSIVASTIMRPPQFGQARTVAASCEGIAISNGLF